MCIVITNLIESCVLVITSRDSVQELSRFLLLFVLQALANLKYVLYTGIINAQGNT